MACVVRCFHALYVCACVSCLLLWNLFYGVQCSMVSSVLWCPVFSRIFVFLHIYIRLHDHCYELCKALCKAPRALGIERCTTCSLLLLLLLLFILLFVFDVNLLFRMALSPTSSAGELYGFEWRSFCCILVNVHMFIMFLLCVVFNAVYVARL